MRVLITTGHPAQVHNFRELKKELEAKGHEVYWLATDKDISRYLLDFYNIEYKIIARPRKGIFSKLLTLVKNTLTTIKFIKSKRIDFVVSRINPPIVLGSYLCRVPQIGLTDTEVAGAYDTIFSRLLGATLTGRSFERELGRNHLRYNGNIELCYLHPNRFMPSECGYSILDIEEGTPYVVMRFVAWEAFHDQGHGGISNTNKLRVIEEISKYAKVFVSSEKELPEEFEKYRICIPFEKMHAVLNDAVLFYGEGASMASESALLGTPAIYVNDLWAGSTNEEEKAGLLWSFKTDEASQLRSIDCAVKLLIDTSLKSEMEIKLRKFLNDKIDVTAFLLWFIENYPQSKKMVHDNSDYQNNFK